MTVAVRNDNKTPLVVPRTVRRKAGFRSGEELEFRASGGVITIVPKLPAADDEYTREERRAIDERLAKANADIEAGRVHGPFTARGAATFIERLAKRRAVKGKKPIRSRQ